MKRFSFSLLLIIIFAMSSCVKEHNFESIKTNEYEVIFDNCGYGEEFEKLSNCDKLPNVLPILFEDGYQFDGWYLDKEYTRKVYGGESIEINTTLYAKWISVEVTSGLEFVLSSDGLYYILISAYECKDSNIVIPSHYENIPVKYIGEQVFENNQIIESVTIPSTVEKISGYSFSNCGNLKTLIVGKGLKEVDKYAFCNCPNLEKIIVDSNNTVLDSRDNCNAIIETASNNLLIGCKGTIIPNSVRSIGKYAFYGSGLTYISIPNGVVKISGCAFHSCSSLEKICIPETLTTIDLFAFVGCSVLYEVYNNSNLDLSNSNENGKISANATNIYNKGEWHYVDGLPVPIG